MTTLQQVCDWYDAGHRFFLMRKGNGLARQVVVSAEIHENTQWPEDIILYPTLRAPYAVDVERLYWSRQNWESQGGWVRQYPPDHTLEVYDGDP